MKCLKKYPCDTGADATCRLSVHRGATLVSVQISMVMVSKLALHEPGAAVEKPCAFFEVDPSQPEIERKIYFHPIGQPIEDSECKKFINIIQWQVPHESGRGIKLFIAGAYEKYCQTCFSPVTAEDRCIEDPEHKISFGS